MPVFIAIAAATAAAHHLARQSDNEKNEPTPIDASLLQNLTPIDLLQSEERFIYEQPLRAIAFYEGNLSEAAPVLWNALSDMVQKNPWLCGWLIKGGKDTDTVLGNAPIRIWYNESSCTMHPGIFQLYPRGLIRLSRSTPHADIEKVLDAFDVSVKSNQDTLNNMQEPLFKVSIIPEYSDTESLPDGFAVIVSMSSMFGDDYTFFRLYNMLIGSDVVSLNPRRVTSFDNNVNNLMGNVEAKYVQHITGDPSWERLFISDEFDQSAQLQGSLFEVSNTWLNDVKKSKLDQERKSTDEHSFFATFKSPLEDLIVKDRDEIILKRISNTDIIVSWFWNIVRPDVGLLEINLREHVKEASATHAGNYTNAIAYTPEDYKTAERVRKSLNSFCRLSKNSDPPSILPRVRVNTRFSIVSNHLALCDTKQMADCTHENDQQKFKLIRHMPLYFATALKVSLPKRMSFLNLFQMNQEKVGCFIVAPADVMSKIETCGIVGETIFSF